MKKEIFLVSCLVLSISTTFGVQKKETSINIGQVSSSNTKSTSNTEKIFQSPAKAMHPGEKLFKDKGCTVCHQVSIKLVGPSLKTIATAYANNKKGLVAFLKNEGKPIVDPAQASVMHPQIAITKALPANELDILVNYILSTK